MEAVSIGTQKKICRTMDSMIDYPYHPGHLISTSYIEDICMLCSEGIILGNCNEGTTYANAH